MHGDLHPRPDDHLVVPRPLHQQRLHHGQRHRSRVRAATAANFEHNFGHYYGQIFHLSSSKSRLSRSRWSTLVQIPLIPEGYQPQCWMVSKSRPIPKASLAHKTQWIIFQYYSRMRRGRGKHFTHTTISYHTGLGNLSSSGMCVTGLSDLGPSGENQQTFRLILIFDIIRKRKYIFYQHYSSI